MKTNPGPPLDQYQRVYEIQGRVLLPTAAFDRLDIAMIEKTADGGGLP